MLGHEQRDEHVDVKEGNHAPLRVGSVRQTVDVFHGEDGCTGPGAEHRHAAFEAEVSIGHSSEQSFCELIHLQARLARQIREPGLQACIQCDCGRWHDGTFQLLPDRRTKTCTCPSGGTIDVSLQNAVQHLTARTRRG